MEHGLFGLPIRLLLHRPAILTFAAIAACHSGDLLSSRYGASGGVPLSVSGGMHFVALSVGNDRACGLIAGGAAYCWTVKLDSVSPPAALPGGLFFTAVSAGWTQNCGLAVSQAAYCWNAAPVPVSDTIRFLRLSTGGEFTCALTPSQVAYCWGLNFDGELGNGSTGDDSGGGQFNVPVLVNGGLNFTALSAGWAHACALTAAGVAYCWGDNTYGQLGLGTNNGPQHCYPAPSLCSSRPQLVAGSLIFTGISAGGEHTCAITATGAVYCWGDNRFGELGLGTAAGPESCIIPGIPGGTATDTVVCSTTPRKISGGLTFGGVSVGGFHACALAQSGTAYCWGLNVYGGLGLGSSGGQTDAPVRVVGQHQFNAISAGLNYDTCGLTTDGTAFCWGGTPACGGRGPDGKSHPCDTLAAQRRTRFNSPSDRIGVAR